MTKQTPAARQAAADRVIDTLLINGLSYLLCSDGRGGEYVQRYTREELLEVFTSEQILALSLGDAALNNVGCGISIRYDNMLLAARNARG